MRKLFSGVSDGEKISLLSFIALAKAFKDVASFEWLATGKGEFPEASGPMRPLGEVYPREVSGR